MLRRLLREQMQRVEQGLAPINVMRDPSANKRIPTGAWNTILSPAEAAAQPSAKTSDAQRGPGAPLSLESSPLVGRVGRGDAPVGANARARTLRQNMTE